MLTPTGFFDDRIALTIPQEGGSGADGCWRIADDLAHTPNGPKVENAAQIVQGDAWFSPIFSNYVNTIPTLPYDHHSLSAVLAPRGLFIVENSGIDYLAPLSSFGCSTAARIVYKALGAEGNLGFTQSNHGHCAFPSSEQGVLNTYINRFLLGQTGTADTFQTSGGTFTWVAGKWIDWVAPTLS